MAIEVILDTVHWNKKYLIAKSDKKQCFNIKQFSSEHL